jgi:hypothetical protein
MKIWPFVSKGYSVGGDRRRDIRKKSSMPATVQVLGERKRIRCTVTDINLTGMFLEIPHCDWPVGQQLQVLFQFEVDGNSRFCGDTVRVVRQSEWGVGVKYERYDNQHQCTLQMMLHCVNDVQASHATYPLTDNLQEQEGEPPLSPRRGSS